MEQAVKLVSCSPSKDDIVFQSDFNGDENLQIYIINEKGGEARYLTPEHKGSQVFFDRWNKNGRKFLFTSNKRDKRFFDTFVYDVHEDKETCIHQSDSPYVEVPSDWSKNERYIIFNKFYSNNNQDILLYDTKKGTMFNITEHKGNMKNFLGLFGKNEDIIYFLSDYEQEFTGLAYYKIKNKEIGWFVNEKWDIVEYKISKSGKFMLYSINENGITRMKLKNMNSGRTATLKLPRGNCLAFEFTPNEKKLVLLYDGPQNPNDIYVYDIQKNILKQVTYSMIGGIPKKDFTMPVNIRYKSFDDRDISANLYIPKWIKKDASNPAIVWPHGGPEWQDKNVFNKYFQILTNRGYIVIAPNFRGSTGYGKSFQNLIYKDWGGNEFKDVLGSYEYLTNTGYVDKNKIAVVGGSFGGFMTLTCITKAPELWRCAVDIFGPSNLLTFINTVPEYWKPGTAVLVGDPEKDKELLEQRSPINFVDNIKCPLFIIQGANDPRVAKAESDQIVGKLKAQNKTIEYLVLDDEGHGFSKVSNQIKVWENICNFLDKYMK
jgi:dipeptidyl aminopeptidase/acylaminoacyl peptidase